MALVSRVDAGNAIGGIVSTAMPMRGQGGPERPRFPRLPPDDGEGPADQPGRRPPTIARTSPSLGWWRARPRSSGRVTLSSHARMPTGRRRWAARATRSFLVRAGGERRSRRLGAADASPAPTSTTPGAMPPRSWCRPPTASQDHHQHLHQRYGQVVARAAHPRHGGRPRSRTPGPPPLSRPPRCR